LNDRETGLKRKQSDAGGGEMIFYRIKSEGIAHNSYFIGSDSEAVVIDPRRDCEEYMSLARKYHLNISRIFETHRNEDYAIGSIELEYLTGAEIWHGPGLEWKYGRTLKDGEVFEIGKLWLEAIRTPGHTDESMTYILADQLSPESLLMVFSGDALFFDAVGRIDLYGPSEAERMAANLYDSIHQKILPLGDGAVLYPAHGAGSVCGKDISDRDNSTIGIEKARNPWLRINDKKEFIRQKVAEKLERPFYFRRMEKYNLEGPPLLKRLPETKPLTPAEFREKMERGAVVVDTGLPEAFNGHIKGAYSIWLQGLSVFAGWVLPYDRPILLVPENNTDVETAVRYLVRLGYDRIEGFLDGGTNKWKSAGYPVEQLTLLKVNELKQKLDAGENLLVLDVREQDEWDSGHIDGAIHSFVGHLEEKLSDIPRDREIAVMCSVGHRGSLAASILLRAGFERVCNLLGGYDSWVAAGYMVVENTANK
jgi:hydroxyacylglutathione hydrolase